MFGPDPYDIIMYEEMYESEMEFWQEMYKHGLIDSETYRQIVENTTMLYTKMAQASAICETIGEWSIFLMFFGVFFFSWILLMLLLDR